MYKLTALVLLLYASSASAGMPTLNLSDIARVRLEVMSFFLVALLLSAWGVKAIWNWLRKDFTKLPRLSYGKSLAIVGLWGFVFVLVLTMISGARELMTPGAWEKVGLTHRVKTQSPADEDYLKLLQEQRRERLIVLKDALWRYADNHGGQFPASDQTPEIDRRTWESAEPSRVRFVYVGGQRRDAANAGILACEPPVFSGGRLALYTDGQIRHMTDSDIRTTLAERAQ
jgi:hypothetical protein